MNIALEQPHNQGKWNKYDTVSLIVLISLASVIGIYLIATTVLISKDGVLYIEQAKLFEHDSTTVLKGNTPGYPMLLFIAHKAIGLLKDNSSLQGWILTAQGVTLLCRILSVIPLYLIGKRLVGNKNSFYAILILILLPHPAHMSAEVTREWPYLLFLATGLLMLLRGSKSVTPWLFGTAGLVTGFCYIIRPEGAQLVVFGLLWFIYKLIRPGLDLSRFKLSVALFAILIGFVIPVTPYAIARGRILPEKVREILFASSEFQHEYTLSGTSDIPFDEVSKADFLNNLGESFYELFERISENLIYYFVPPMFVGIYLYLKKRSLVGKTEKFFISAFVAFNVAAPILLYQNYDYMSRRHTLPILLIGIFYVPAGLRAISNRLESGISKKRSPANKISLRWFTILLSIGIVVCLPKLIRPFGAEKGGYRDASEWLKNNADATDIIAVMDPRISFYADRKGIFYQSDIPDGVDYIVEIVRSSDNTKSPVLEAREVYSVGISGGENDKKKVVIYKII